MLTLGDAKQGHSETYVVGIGASAGGLKTLINFFKYMPDDTGMIFLVVQHLSPNTTSKMDELLARHTSMKVIVAKNGLTIEPNCIYLQPARSNLNLFNGRLLLDDLEQQQGLHLPIDYFFHSLAEDRKNRAIGIVLSGTGSDGSRGLPAIKKAGGLVLVQEPDEAEFNGMPNSAIATGLVDYICPVADMAHRITDYIHHPRLHQDAETICSEEETDLIKIIALLRRQTNVDFTLYKRITVIRRINRRMAIARCTSMHDYAEFLRIRPNEVTLLYRDLLIGVTKFFRDRKEFEYLQNKVIPLLVESLAGQEEIRVWDVGCSTGEEAYTLALLLYDHVNRKTEEKKIEKKITIKVFATDLDQYAIEKAARGFYPDGIAADIPPKMLERYFNRVENGFVVRRHIRELVIFAQQNLLDDPPFTRLHFIACRNLLIYLQPSLQKEVLSIFHFALREDGFLFLGNSETVTDMAEHFVMLDRQMKIYKHVGKGNLPMNQRLRSTRIPVARRIEAESARQHFELVHRLEIQETYYQQIINKLTLACLILNSNGDILETFGRTDLVLQPQPGKMKINIHTMLPSLLLLPVTTAMRACQREEHREILYDGIKIHEKNESRYLLRAVSLASGESAFPPGSILIALERMPDSIMEASSIPGRSNQGCQDPEVQQHILDLQREICFTRESLEAANEELQTANEELQAANEELLASNEELQSTNEELNSVNEELSTVNTEYQSKILELTELYNDIDNLFCSTEIGFIFVDQQLRIRKYTPSVLQLINLMESDLGRRISDMAAPILGDITKEFNHILLTRTKQEKIVHHGKNSWYLVQFIPYIDETNEVNGMVISIVDVSEQKRAEETLRHSTEILEQILEASPAPTMMVSHEGKIRFVNEMAAVLFGSPGQNLLECSLSSQNFQLTDLEGNSFPDAQDFICTITGQAKKKEPIVIRLAEQGNRQSYFLSINANTLSVKDKSLSGVVLTFTEVARQT
jgi:two-component system CheB/CheR fusion protein